MPRKDYTTIPVERSQLEQLQAVRESMGQQASRSLRWGDFLGLLLAYRDQVLAGSRGEEEPLIAHMAQDDDEPLTEEQLEAMGITAYPGLPVTLSDEDQERIAELVVEKLMRRLEPLLRGEGRASGGERDA